jgi:hypothetical protein
MTPHEWIDVMTHADEPARLALVTGATGAIGGAIGSLREIT